MLNKDFTFGVEVIVPGSFPALVTSFAREQIAEAWITDYNAGWRRTHLVALCEGIRKPDSSFGDSVLTGLSTSDPAPAAKRYD